MEIADSFAKMFDMRPCGTPQQLEARRRRAIELLQTGENLSAVAQALSASVSSVHRWFQTYQARGLKGLRPRPTPGRPPKLTYAQQAQVVELLLRGPSSAGYDTELWTLGRVAQAIKKEYGVSYHPCHVWRLLDRLGWSCQKPEQRARERDEGRIERWRRRRWPHIKKRSPGRSKHRFH
jgi:transposase